MPRTFAELIVPVARPEAAAISVSGGAAISFFFNDTATTEIYT